ncbi:PREDICTED: uncharacterized protein LOC108611890 [Drosophila arizonae]|uniref:Uncharacterized protein LOC108611890 n=1 Tax=Drosophila arizonae TaxID=7263 RepID=A0ABM1NZ32_DROAR|nr:PREDICTED: uncharacterized protein LOC108611890 [Drosophila arizonae]
MKRVACKTTPNREASRCQGNACCRIMDVKSWVFRRNTGDQTTWLSTQNEMIAIQNKYIDELGINIFNYREPRFEAIAQPDQEAAAAANARDVGEIIPSAAIFERISAQCLYQVVKLSLAANPLDDVIRILWPGLRSRLYRERLHCTRPNTKIVKTQKLDKLLNSQHVKQITSREVFDRAKVSNQHRMPRQSRVVKEVQRAARKQSQLLICLKLSWRRRHCVPGRYVEIEQSEVPNTESTQIVHWISVEKQEMASPQLPQKQQIFTGHRIEFELLGIESKELLLRETEKPEMLTISINSNRLWIYAFFFFIYTVLLVPPNIIEFSTWSLAEASSYRHGNSNCQIGTTLSNLGSAAT